MSLDNQIEEAVRSVRAKHETSIMLALELKGVGARTIDVYSAARLVQEVVNGPANPFTGVLPDVPCTMIEAVRAVKRVIPELFADYQKENREVAAI